MDEKTLHRILREEKARLNISLRHQVKPYQGVLPVEGTALLATDDVFQLTVARGKMVLLYHQDKMPALTDNDGRLMIRHELCHALDRLEGKIGHAFFGFKPSRPYLIETELMNGVIAETTRSYYEFVMARRYITLFGLDEFRIQNEIGMEEFLSLSRNLILELQQSTGQLIAYALFGIIFGVFKEAVKVYFYCPRDVRFPGGTWDIIEWFCQDFGHLETLKISWRDKSFLLAFEALAVFENFDVASALEPALTRCKEQFTYRAYATIGKMTSHTQILHDRWVQRYNTLSNN